MIVVGGGGGEVIPKKHSLDFRSSEVGICMVLSRVYKSCSFSVQIWEAVDPRQDGYVTRDGLYKALALTALAQQGKSISAKALEQFVDSGKIRHMGNLVHLL